MSKVFLALQLTDDSRSIIDALLADNPDATLDEQPAMVKIDCENRLTLKRESVSERMGRPFDLQELHLSLISPPPAAPTGRSVRRWRGRPRNTAALRRSP